MPITEKSSDYPETYEDTSESNELYRLIQEGIDDIENGETLTEKEVLKNMETSIKY